MPPVGCTGGFEMKRSSTAIPSHLQCKASCLICGCVATLDNDRKRVCLEPCLYSSLISCSVVRGLGQPWPTEAGDMAVHL